MNFRHFNRMKSTFGIKTACKDTFDIYRRKKP